MVYARPNEAVMKFSLPAEPCTRIIYGGPDLSSVYNAFTLASALRLLNRVSCTDFLLQRIPNVFRSHRREDAVDQLGSWSRCVSRN